MAEIVREPSGDADAGTAEDFEFLQKKHGKNTENRSGKTVKKHRKITESKGSKQYPDERYCYGCRKTKAIQCNDDNKVGKPEFNAGNHAFQRIWKKQLVWMDVTSVRRSCLSCYHLHVQV